MLRKKYFIISVIIGLFFVPIIAIHTNVISPPNYKYSIQGEVYAKTTGQPINGAHVYLYLYDMSEGLKKINGREDVTDSGGHYLIEYYYNDFPNMLFYMLYIVVTCDGYDLALEEIHDDAWLKLGAVQPNIFAYTDIGLRTYTGYVYDRNTYAPIVNAKVEFGRTVIRNIIAQWITTCYTDSYGKYTISYDPGDTFIYQLVIRVSKSGYLGSGEMYNGNQNFIHQGGTFTATYLRAYY